VLSAKGVTSIDSSQAYGKSEAILGRTKPGNSFTIHTKWGIREAYNNPTMTWASKDYILTSTCESVARLGVKQVDIFYLHFPDRKTSLEDTLAGVDVAYREGLFRRFGVSNFTAEAVKSIHDIASAKGYVLLTVYQGQYNPLARHFETDLFPTLRKLGISFYAYSLLTRGLFTKTLADFKGGKSRFPEGSSIATGHCYSNLCPRVVFS
jgi:aflatoxin B1 aldehyde reductase